jgi:hypothetical protein
MAPVPLVRLIVFAASRQFIADIAPVPPALRMIEVVVLAVPMFLPIVIVPAPA